MGYSLRSLWKQWLNTILQKRKVNSWQSGPPDRQCFSQLNKSLFHFLAITVAVCRRKWLSSKPGGCIVQTRVSQALWEQLQEVIKLYLLLTSEQNHVATDQALNWISTKIVICTEITVKNYWLLYPLGIFLALFVGGFEKNESML